ncbi:MAG: ATP-dependent RecD-like DNA helicase [Bacillota bacterium]
MPESQETLTGTISRFIFQRDGFAIFKIDGVTAIGEITGVHVGEEIKATGAWETHPKYGRQFRVKHWEKPLPSTRETAAQFLASGLIKGVGPALARKIVDALGEDAVKVILEDPDALRGVKGVGKKAPEIRRQVQETYQVHRVVADLTGLGLTAKTAMKAYKVLGPLAAEYVKHNPYCLTKVSLIGFARADEIARRMGVLPSSKSRIEAGLRHVLEEALWNEGHTCLPRNLLLARTKELLNKETVAATEEQLAKALSSMDDLAAGHEEISLRWVREYEESIAQDIKRLTAQKYPPEPLPDSLLEGLTEAQKNAVTTALTHGLSVLTGGPGVGKTFTVKAVIEAFRYQEPFGEIVLCAPTGRAARRLSEVTGYHASTVHKLLGMREDAALRNRKNPLRCDLILVDETSMVDLVMAKRLLEAVPDGARVLLVGDADQLPSVGPGNILRDILGIVPTARLTEIFRQAAESQIVVNAHRVNRGEMIWIDRYKDDFVFVERDDPEEIARTIAAYYKSFKCDPLDVQVLSPMKKGPVGTVALNRLIQGEKTGPEIRYGQHVYRVNDKVIQTRNNYDKGVFNGDIGIIRKIEKDEEREAVVHVQYNGDLIPYALEEVRELEPAFACTTHKAQGSEFKIVILPATTAHYMMLYRNLLYTALTRAKEKVVVVGTKKALAVAIKNDRPVQRYTKLKQLLST